MNPVPIFAADNVMLFGVPVSEEILALIIIFGAVFGSRLLRTLTQHQQRMAEIMRSSTSSPQVSQEMQMMRQELDVLKATVNQQTLMLDSISSQQKALSDSIKADGGLSQRLRAE